MLSDRGATWVSSGYKYWLPILMVGHCQTSVRDVLARPTSHIVPHIPTPSHKWHLGPTASNAGPPTTILMQSDLKEQARRIQRPQTTMTIEHSDVLIVGAGPVGMFLALLLHQQGVSVKLVERQKALYPLPRAVAFDHESRRLFGIVGLADEVAQIVEERNVKGGEDGQNFVWRDKNLKSE